MAARRHLPAAVLREGAPGAENAARLVPAHAVDVKVGGSVLGYKVGKRNARRPLTAEQFQAAERIKDVSRLLAWRADGGEAPSEHSIEAALDVLADAARFLPSGRYSLANVREHLPAEWRDMPTDSQVLHAITAPRPPRDGIAGNREAGRTLGVRLVEVLAIEAEDGGRPFPMLATDEPEEARALRRASRRRQMEAARKRRARQAKKGAEYCNRVRISSYRKGDADTPATLQGDGVRAAIMGGAAKVSEIVRVTGLPATTVRPLLARAIAAGTISRTGRGSYALASPSPLAQQDGEERDAAGTVHSGPEVPPDPHEPSAEVQRDTSALHPVADTGRALRARGTACGAGPDGMHLAPATALHPRRPAFSRLPGALSIAFIRSTTDASSCVA